MPDPAVLKLLAFHLIAGLAAGVASADTPAVSSAVFLGLIFSQAALLGIWAGLAGPPIVLRLAGLAVGSLYLARLCGRGINEISLETMVVVILPALLVALVTGGARTVQWTLRRVDTIGPEHREALQFGIRHLMLLTFVVACLIMAGKLLGERVRGADIMAVVVVLAICYAVVGVTAMWATLGSGRVWFRSLVCMIIAVSAGYLSGSLIDYGWESRFWVGTTAIQALVLLASLQVVRWAGYRWVAS